MKKIVFLLEEPSMKEFLDEFLPRIIPGQDFICIKHEGKQDLEKSIPRKLRAWQEVHFVIIRDNDGAQCQIVKERLRSLCKQAGRPDALIRIACQELESWYLGSLAALSCAYSRPKLALLSRQAKYRDPDHLANPSGELSRMIPGFRKIEGARRMGKAMPINENENRSRSFRIFVQGIQKLSSPQ